MKILIYLFCIFLCLSVQAENGSSGTRGGGDPTKFPSTKQARAVTQYAAVLTYDAFVLTLHYLKWAQGQDLRPGQEAEQRDLKLLIKNGLIEDLIRSPFTIEYSGGCKNRSGSEAAASSEIGKKASVICFSATLLANERASVEEIVGLIVHELAWHFDFDDSSHELADFVRLNLKECIAKNSGCKKDYWRALERLSDFDSETFNRDLDPVVLDPQREFRFVGLDKRVTTAIVFAYVRNGQLDIERRSLSNPFCKIEFETRTDKLPAEIKISLKSTGMRRSGSPRVMQTTTWEFEKNPWIKALNCSAIRRYITREDLEKIFGGLIGF